MRARRGAAKIAALVAYIIVILVATPQAQQPIAFAGSPNGISAGPAAGTPTDVTAVDLLVGRSTIVNTGSAISRVSLTVPDVADAMVTAPSQLLIHGKTPGTISLFVWDRAGAIKTYEVSVRRDLTHLIAQLKELFPGEPITVMGSGKDVVISGTVTSKYVIDKAAEVAGGYVEKKEYVVNLLKQVEGVASNQVMLRVRFAEVSRSALTELGVNLFTGPTGYKDWIARTTTQQFAAPNYSEMSRTADLDDNLTSASGKYSLSDFLNIFVFNNKYNIGTVIRALSEKGLFQSLAEPNLIASNGKEASFLAGGEYPYPVVQPGSGGNSVTIMFKEFGIRLNFTPTVLGGDMVNLKVRPEVSALDFSNAITLQGFRVPALSTRRTETEVELQNGQTFAIAGLMNNTVTDSMRKIPGIGDVPILGWLFKSKAMQKNQTELVVMITPHIVRRGGIGVSESLPTAVEPYLPPPSKTHPQPEQWLGSPRHPANNSSPNNTTYKPKSGGQPQRGGGDQQPQAMPQQSSAQPMTNPEPARPVPASQMPAAAVQSEPQVEAAIETPKVDVAREAAKLREEQQKAADAQKAAERQAAAEKATADKKAAADKAIADKKAALERERQQKLNAERAKREAEVAKKNQEEEAKRQAELKKHEKALADAAARLKEAQDAYKAAQGDKKKGVQ